MKPRPPLAPQETKPLENKYYEDVRLASHLEVLFKTRAAVFYRV